MFSSVFSLIKKAEFQGLQGLFYTQVLCLYAWGKLNHNYRLLLSSQWIELKILSWTMRIAKIFWDPLVKALSFLRYSLKGEKISHTKISPYKISLPQDCFQVAVLPCFTCDGLSQCWLCSSVNKNALYISLQESTCCLKWGPPDFEA